MLFLISVRRHAFLAVVALGLSAPGSWAATFYLSEQTDLIAVTGRGGPDTSYYGWDTFNELGSRDLPNTISDGTPELGTNPGGALIVTNNVEDHISNASGNYYSGTGRVNETITADSVAVIAGGFTTIIAQGITAFGDFGSPLQFSAINGVLPTIAQAVNAFGGGGANGKGQFWALWELPGNQDSFQFTITTDPAANGGGGSFVSIDKLTVDTLWSAGKPANDLVFAAPVPEPAVAMFLALACSLIGGTPVPLPALTMKLPLIAGAVQRH